MRNKKYINLTLGYFFLFVVMLKSQEGTRPMTGNINLIFPELKEKLKKHKTLPVSKTASAVINIPFFDDFAYATRSAYPDPNFWSDSSLYINTGMARAPLSIGVGTFDGLNKNGFPYNPNTTFSSSDAFPADTLTSNAINLFTSGTQTLQPSDSVALLFYYQLRGYGDSPEIQDSLMVDFYKPKQQVWNKRVWSLRGNTNPNNNDTVFKRAFVWITDTAYFHEGFRFRFRNKAATNGNFDNWHVDYVYLDKNRSIIADTAWNDLSIGYLPTPFLKNYAAMPWEQYTAFEMADKYSNYIRYNGTSTVNTTYEYRLYDGAGNQIHAQSYGALNLPPFKQAGWQQNSVHANPSINYTISTLSDSVDFTLKHYMLNLAGDVNLANDTVYQFQRFRNYYAYDDGTCETGYYVLGLGGKMAQKYVLNFNDTLRGLRIYFDPIGSINLTQNSYEMKINVYSGSGSGPGTRIFVSDSIYPIYSNQGHNYFREYLFNNPLPLNAGVYYIGIQQFVAAGVTIGFDRNYDFSKNLYYDSGNGWTQSSVKGSLMMRPVFGKKIESPVGLQAVITEYDKVRLYPNPVSDWLQLELGEKFLSESMKYEIVNLMGMIVAEGVLRKNDLKIQTSTFSNGIYLLKLYGAKGQVVQHKLIVQH
jgi:hypothetical protein